MLMVIGRVMFSFPLVSCKRFKLLSRLTSSIIEKLKSLQRIIDENIDHFLENNSFRIQRSSFEVEDNLHISLSHPFVLRYHQIKAFVESFQKHCRDFQR
jgi:hypothetical protein